MGSVAVPLAEVAAKPTVAGAAESAKLSIESGDGYKRAVGFAKTAKGGKRRLEGLREEAALASEGLRKRAAVDAGTGVPEPGGSGV